jgi:hypothetical protein
VQGDVDLTSIQTRKAHLFMRLLSSSDVGKPRETTTLTRRPPDERVERGSAETRVLLCREQCVEKSAILPDFP